MDENNDRAALAPVVDQRQRELQKLFPDADALSLRLTAHAAVAYDLNPLLGEIKVLRIENKRTGAVRYVTYVTRQGAERLVARNPRYVTHYSTPLLDQEMRQALGAHPDDHVWVCKVLIDCGDSGVREIVGYGIAGRSRDSAHYYASTAPLKDVARTRAERPLLFRLGIAGMEAERREWLIEQARLDVNGRAAIEPGEDIAGELAPPPEAAVENQAADSPTAEEPVPSPERVPTFEEMFSRES